jgi:hypothetical protein
MSGNKITHTLTVGATTAIPFPPTLANDKGFTSITEPADQNTTTIVSPGDKMVWKKSGDITSIDAITETSGNNLFSKDPALQKDGSWLGVIGNMKSGTTETYSITYQVEGAPENPYVQDPKLKMR